MSNANGVNTPTTGDPVGADLGGPALSEKWEYRSIAGMLMYLAANTHPDIAYSVHQAAMFSHNPKNSHALAIKRIMRYLKKTQDKGMYMHQDGSFNLSCYVDSDFGILFGSEDLEPLYQSNQELDISLSSGMFLSYGYQNFRLKLLFLRWRQSILLYPSQCVILFHFER